MAGAGGGRPSDEAAADGSRGSAGAAERSLAKSGAGGTVRANDGAGQRAGRGASATRSKAAQVAAGAAPNLAGRASAPGALHVSATTVPLGERAGGTGVISPSELWSGGALNVGTILSVPLALGGLGVAFVVVQWLIDRRDPKFVDAPAREEDDSVGFD